MKKNIKAIINGGQVPQGRVRVSGAKNSATRLLAASLICDEKVILKNFPTELVDARYKRDFINKCGGKVEFDVDNEIATIYPDKLEDKILESYDFPIRTTYLLVAGLLKTNKIAKIPYPGGCKIGNRGYDLHIMVWEQFGATVIETSDYIEITLKNEMQPCIIDFPISTIGGTENALICASITDGKTTIKNAYISPEVNDLIKFLKQTGVEINVIGKSYIEVIGKKFIQGAIYEVISDRIEAITWVVYGILSGGDITIENVPFEDMEIPLIHLKEAGVDLYCNSNNIHISANCLNDKTIYPFEVATGTHPGIISDMQPFYTLLALHADGKSRIFDYRYPERLKYCEELEKFYINQLEWETGKITIVGKSNQLPTAASVFSTDLRGSMALVMAALLADGTSTIYNVEMALRGYNKLDEKLSKLGITIEISK